MRTKTTKTDLTAVEKAAALEDKLLPAEYRAASGELAVAAQQDYFQRVEIETSYDELVKSYESSNPYSQSTTTFAPRSGVQALVPSQMRERDALAEYRNRHGLDKLREALLQEIVKAASFDAGLEFLAEHIASLPSNALLRTLRPKQDLSLQEQVEYAYPDLNADEVSWLALIKNFDPTETPWIGDEPAHSFYPASLVGMDPRGLAFAHSLDAAEDHDSLSPRTAEEVAGVTGNDSSVFYYPFRHNVAEGMKAVVMLSLNEGDIFKQLKEEESVIAMKRGDSMLLRVLLELRAEEYGLTPEDLKETIADIVRSPRNRFSSRELERLRRSAAETLHSCDFRDVKGKSQPVFEVVKMLGMLERVPSFISQSEQFRGIVTFYAGTAQFVDETGRIVDSVPIVEHLRNRFGQHVSECAHTSDLRENATRVVFEEIYQRIRDANIRLDNKMALDRLQEDVLLKYNIAVPIRSTYHVEEATTTESYFVLKSADSRCLKRFLKFGHLELSEIKLLLSQLPPIFTKEVRSLRKGTIELLAESILRTGNMMAACYNFQERSVCINIPEVGPQESRAYSIQLLMRHALSPGFQAEQLHEQQYEDTLMKLRHNFLHTLVHEFAESVAALAGESLIEKWASIDLQATKSQKTNRRQLYVSLYATTSPKEDFCESCAVYVLAGETFRKLARHSNVLAMKYEFLKRLFSSDAQEREFADRYRHHVYEIVGDPNRDWEQIFQEHFAVQFERTQEMSERDIRDLLSNRLVSYEDVAEVIEESEKRGDTISQEEATTIALARQHEKVSSEEGLVALHSVFLFVSEKIREVALRYNVSMGNLEDKISQIIDALYDGDAKIVQKLLLTTKSKQLSQRSIREIVKQLQPIIRAHSSSLDEYRSRYMTESDEVERERSLKIVAALVAEMQRRS